MAFEDLAANASEAVDPAIVASAEIPEGDDFQGDEHPEGTEEQHAGEQEQEPEQLEPVEEYTVDGRSIPANVRALFKSPEGGKEAKTAWMERAAFRETFPKGPKQAQELIAEIEEMGGRDGLETLRTSAQELRSIDEMLQSGNTAIIDRVASQSPNAIGSLAPAIMDKWYQVDPENCNRTLCGVISNTFNQSIGESGANLVMNLKFAAQLIKLGQNDEAVKILDGVAGWSQTFGQIAAQPPKQAPPEVAGWKKEVETERQRVEEEKLRMFDDQTSASVGEIRRDIIDRELKPYLQGRTISSGKRDLLMNAILAEEKRILEGDKQFVSKIGSYRSARDKTGVFAATKNKLNMILPAITQRIGREMIGSPARPKPVQTPQQKQEQQKAAPKLPERPQSMAEIMRAALAE